MTLYSAFYSGLSGLATNASALNVIGNNLANINTVGFKGSTATFRDIFSTSLGWVSTQGNGNPIQIGLGVQTNAVSQDFSQSSFQSTGNSLDMAIQGNGFFTLRTAEGRQVYSRAGDFTRNNDGYLVASDGSQVMGWNRDFAGSGTASTTLSPIRIDAGTTTAASATKTFRMGVNLNASATADSTSTLTTPIQVYDSQGNAQTLTVAYTKSGNNTWDYVVTGPAGATLSGAASGRLSFSTSGTLSSIDLPPYASPFTASGKMVNPSVAIAWNNGAAPSTIAVSLVNADGSANLTQFSSPSASSSSYQDGYGAGTLRDMSVDQNGVISGSFTNGQVLALAQIALSSFNNMNGLVQAGNNHWAQSLASGAPTVGMANQGGRGSLLGSNLELSNVDVAGEFTKLILSQRGYEANSKIVTTTDQLMQVTLGLKQ